MTANWLTFAIASLATYRLARMVAEEEGPDGIFTRLRGRFDPDQQTWLGRGLNCPLCVGFWIAPIVMAMTSYTPEIVYWFGLAGAMVILKKWEQKR